MLMVFQADFSLRFSRKSRVCYHQRPARRKERFMEQDEKDLTALFPDVAAQLRAALSNLYLAAVQLAAPEARENDPALDEKAALLDQSYYRLLRLVNNLSSAAILTSHDPLPMQDRDVVALVSDVCEKSGGLAAMLGLELRFVCALDRHICAVCPDALEQAVYHLLSNAMKFTPAGGRVRVEVRVKRQQVLLSVTDTGSGIPEQQLAALFDGCFRPAGLRAAIHGLGLGLPLCRRVAEAHGGTLLAESHVGTGSRFTLCLPNRQVGSGVSDIRFDYAGGFNRTLLALADALPVRAFRRDNED